MSRLTKTELEEYNIEVLKDIIREGNINIKDNSNKKFLIQIILWKDKQTEKWPIKKLDKN